ncbi:MULTISPECIES: hypothetical protein [unclassified Janthinobacterium]|uniref:hypothetical protein n=1 Tax=unclassified Janthinobacterium TaxID=2610881 RepID=UPI00111316F0|nr:MULTISPECIES: hypothetical protein [unclassified Janthinobacterium]
MAILLPLRASIARTFATRSCSWLIPERGSMPITINLDLSGRSGVPAGRLFFIQHSDGAATVARKNHPSVFINGVTYA